MTKAAKAGRNDPCPCGSGKKFKKCCETKTVSQTRSRVLVIAVGAVVLMGLIAVIAGITGEKAATGKRQVWDPAHGHYHDVP